MPVPAVPDDRCTGWVTSTGSPAVSAISPSTESNRNGMLSLTTVITVTGRPLRTIAGSLSIGDDALALAVAHDRFAGQCCGLVAARPAS